MARMCSFENRSGRRKSYSLIERSSTFVGGLPLGLVGAPSSLPMLFSSASISHWESVLLIPASHLCSAPYRPETLNIESHVDRFREPQVPSRRSTDTTE